MEEKNKFKNEKIKREKKKAFQKIGYVVLILLTLLIIIISIFAIGLYGFKWQDKLTDKIIRIFPYPVAFVNYKFLRYADFKDDVDTLVYYYNKMSSLEEEDFLKPSRDELEKLALKRIVRNEYTRQVAKKYKISISKLELEQELEKIVNQSGSREEVEETLKELYNWGVEDLKNKVLYYHLLRAKLQEKLAFDDSLQKNKEAENKAEKVLEEIKREDMTFEALAKKYGEDDTAAQGGKLGYFRKGDMVAEFEEAAFKLAVGEVSDLVRTQYGFHIIKILDKKGEGANLQLEASHILIKTQDLDEYLNENIKEARIYAFVKGIKWDRETGEAVIPGFEETSSGF